MEATDVPTPEPRHDWSDAFGSPRQRATLCQSRNPKAATRGPFVRVRRAPSSLALILHVFEVCVAFRRHAVHTKGKHT